MTDKGHMNLVWHTIKIFCRSLAYLSFILSTRIFSRINGFWGSGLVYVSCCCSVSVKLSTEDSKLHGIVNLWSELQMDSWCNVFDLVDPWEPISVLSTELCVHVQFPVSCDPDCWELPSMQSTELAAVKSVCCDPEGCISLPSPIYFDRDTLTQWSSDSVFLKSACDFLSSFCNWYLSASSRVTV